MIKTFNQFINESKSDLSGKNFKTVIPFSDDEFDNFYDNYLEKYKVVSVDVNYDEIDSMNPKPRYSIYYKGDSLGSGIIYAVYDLKEKVLRTSLKVNESEDFDNYETEKSLELKHEKISQLLKTPIDSYSEALKLINKLKSKTEMLETKNLLNCFGQEIFDELIEKEKLEILSYSKDMTLLK